MEILAAARSFLPEFMQPLVIATLNAVHNVETLTERLEGFFESLHINPPTEFMDVVRRITRVARPVPAVDVEEEVVVVDHMGNVVNHPTVNSGSYESRAIPVEDPIPRSRREIRERQGPSRRLIQI